MQPKKCVLVEIQPQVAGREHDATVLLCFLAQLQMKYILSVGQEG